MCVCVFECVCSGKNRHPILPITKNNRMHCYVKMFRRFFGRDVCTGVCPQEPHFLSLHTIVMKLRPGIHCCEPLNSNTQQKNKQNLNTQTCTICGHRKVCWQLDFPQFYLVVMSRGATGNRMVSVVEHLLSDINICHMRLASIKLYRLIPFYVSSNRTPSRLSSPNPSHY